MRHALTKTLVLFLLATTWMPHSAWAGKIELCEKSILTWKVDLGGMSHDFTMTNLRFNEKGGVAFSYNMTSYSVTTGDVVISPEAMATARKQNNYYTGGELGLTNETTVFVSRLVARELKKGGSNMQPEDREMFFNKAGKEKLEVLVDGEKKKLKGTVGVAKGGNRFVIWKHKSYPLILKMKLGWTIVLQSIETVCS